MSMYQYMAQKLQEYGIGTYLFDIRGHGNSQGPRGDAPSAQQVWIDVSSAIEFAQKLYQEAPIVLGGHSSGAGLILNYADWKKDSMVTAYVLLAPFLGPRSDTSYEQKDPEKRFVKKVRLFKLILNMITKGYFFEHDPVVFFNYPTKEKEKDERLLEAYTCAMSTATTPSDPRAIFGNLSKPFLLLIGENDEQFIPKQILSFHQSAKFVKESSISQLLPGAKHLTVVTESPSKIVQGLDNILKKVLYVP